jgi:hypothetical protein|tara:strand:- start:92 stop:193 length:102 start_codon:yes stop_codon:yes gene_type:complete
MAYEEDGENPIVIAITRLISGTKDSRSISKKAA